MESGGREAMKKKNNIWLQRSALALLLLLLVGVAPSPQPLSPAAAARAVPAAGVAHGR